MSAASTRGHRTELESELLKLSALLADETRTRAESAEADFLRIRLALVCWLGFGDREAAGKYLEECDHQSGDVAMLRWTVDCGRAQPAPIRSLLATRVSPGLLVTSEDLWTRVAETFLWHWAETSEAVEAARRALAADPSSPGASTLLTLALELLGDIDSLVSHLQKASQHKSSLRVELATFLGDVLGRGQEAAELLAGFLDGKEAPYAIERLLELAGGLGVLPKGMDETALLQRKVAALAETSPDRRASEYLLADLLARTGETTAAGEILSALATVESRWGHALALLKHRELAAAREDRDRLADVYAELAVLSTDPRWSSAYRYRAAELYSLRPEGRRRSIELARAAALAGDEKAAELTVRLLAQQDDTHQLLEALEEFGKRHGHRHALRWASRIAEWKAETPERALTLLEASLAGQRRAADLLDLFRLLATTKQWDRLAGAAEELAQSYESATGEASATWASIAWLAAGLAAMRSTETARRAERALQRAGDLDPRDVVSRLALALQHQRMGNWASALDALEESLEHFRDPQVRVHILRNIARLASKRLSDPERAKGAIQRALEVFPDDPTLLHELALYEEELGHHETAANLLLKAAEELADSFRAAAVWAELGRLRLSHGMTEEAISALTRALDIDVNQPEILDTLCDIYRKHGRWVELVETLEVALEVGTREPDKVHLEIADILHRRGLDPARALEHYRKALAEGEPGEAALAGVENLCRKHGWWAQLADILADQPQTPGVVRHRAEALERLGRWDELRALLQHAFDAEQDAEQKAEFALQLAALAEERFHDTEEAASWYATAFRLYPGNMKTTRAYQQFLERHERWVELIENLEEEIRLLREVPERRALAHLRIGLVLADRLGRLEEAAAHLESCLSDLPTNRQAQDKLLAVYEQLGDTERQLGLLEHIATHTEDIPTRVALLLKTGAIWEEAGRSEKALEVYLEAFSLQPDNRQAFTAAERLCYKLRRWKDTERLYDTAIHLVEEEGEPAYRLADLYARKGQLLFKYLSQPGEAAATYLKVLELAPEDDKALRFLESIFAREEDWEGLLKAYENRLQHLASKEHIVETLRRAARVAASKVGDRKRAVAYYERLIEVEPGDEEALDALERAYERDRRWDSLTRVLRLRLERTEDDEVRVPLLLRLGLICEEGLGDADSAIDAYKEVLAVDPKNRQALSALARIYEATERWAEFMDVARRQIRITMDKNEKSLLYFKCGSVMEAKFGKEDDAIRYYKAAIKTSATCLPAVHGLRDLYIRRKDWKRVLETLRLEVRLWHEPKERAGVLAQMGRIYLEQLGDPEKAKANFEAALKLDPDSGAAARALFDMAFQAGDWQQAATLAAQLGKKAAREGEPAERSEFLRKRGLVAAYTGYLSVAVENFLASLDLNPNNTATLDDLIDLLASEPEAASVEEILREIESKQGPKPDQAIAARLDVLRGMAAEKLYELEAAEAFYRKAAEAEGLNLKLQLPLVRFLVRLRRAEEAIAELEGFVHRKGVAPADRVEALLEASHIVSEAVMDSRRAEKLCLRALRLDPRNRGALYALVQELVVQKRYQEARKRCQELIDIAADPEDTASAEELGLYYYYLGRIYEAMGDEAKAGLSYRRATDLHPAYPPPVIALARRYFRQGKLSQAESVLSLAARAASEAGQDDNALELRRALARIHMEAGKTESARAELRSIVATEMASDDDRLALASLYSESETELDLATEEVLKVLANDATNVLAVRLIMRIAKAGNKPGLLRRAWRVLEILGRADGEPPIEALSWTPPAPTSDASLPDDLPDEISVPMRKHFGQLYTVIRGPLQAVYPITELGTHHVPYIDWPDREAQGDVLWMAQAFGLPGRLDVFSARNVKYRLAVLEKDGRVQVVVDEGLLEATATRRRFVLAKALAYHRLGATLLWNLGPKERDEVGALLQGMALPQDERQPVVTQFLQALPRKQFRAAERIAQAAGEFMLEANPREWMRSVDLATSQVALAFVDDILEALMALAWLQQEDQILGASQSLAFLYSVVEGRALVPYYLGETHQALVESLRTPRQEP